MKKVWIIVLAVFLLAGALGVPYLMSHYRLLGGRLYSKDLEILELAQANQKDLAQLEEFPQLKQLDLRGVPITPEQIEQLQAKLPQCQIQWLLPFQGRYLPLDTKEVSLTAFTDEEARLLSYLPQLEVINASGCQEYDRLQQLQKQYPDCTVCYQVALGGTTFPQNTTNLQLAHITAQELAQAISWLPDLEVVNVTQPITDTATMATLQAQHPEITFCYSFPLLGITANSSDRLLDLSGIPMDSSQVLEAVLPNFTNLEKVDMCGCGIADADMGALNDRYPQIQFVWELDFGGHAVRTDSEYFMPIKFNYWMNNKDTEKLQYLTELVCLDLGHMNITNSDYLHKMPKLRYLLLGDTKVSDISGCANMPDLLYVELFLTKVKDFSPLLECKKLEDLNICYTRPKDPRIFCQMPWLKNLWFIGQKNRYHIAALYRDLPDTRIVLAGQSSTGNGWRKLKNYYDMRDFLGMPYFKY